MHFRDLLGGASALALSATAVTLISGGAALAQSTGAGQATGNIVVVGERADAAQIAPSATPMTVTQPTSVLTKAFIENDVAATANYDDIVKLSPSVSSVGPNGPGLMENQFLTIRGFQDGQYNLTLDGIAWGDSNDFTHHSTSYLMGHDLGEVSVDRGPGTASTLGDATFGGTIALTTKDPLDHAGVEGYSSFGSFNTYLGGGELDTGALPGLGGAKALVDVEHLSSDGALTNMGQDRTNLFTKVEAPVGDRTTVTFAAMYNNLHQNVGLGATTAQYAALGYNYGLNTNPDSQADSQYNYDFITTDMVYLGIKTELGDGWRLEDKVYSYAYNHLGHNGFDPNGEWPNGTYFGANDVPGQVLHNDYVSYGDIARLAKDFGLVEVRTGFWYDHQLNHRALDDVDFTLGGAKDIGQPNCGAPSVFGQIAPDPTTCTGTSAYPGIERRQTNTLDTFQPYVELDIKPLPGLVITPGVKYDYFRRTIDAPVNQGTYLPLDFARTYDAVLPSLAVHYTPAPSLAVYAQVAQGFLAPNLNTFYTSNPAASTNLQPQTTWNYQAGASYQVSRLTVSGDVYYIDFGNMIGKRNVGATTVFYNQGGVIYQGVELEGTFKLVGGLSLYANGSVNSAKDKTTHQTIANSPDSTAAGGLIFQHEAFNADLLAKYTGVRYGDNPELFKLPGYTITQLSAGYVLHPWGGRTAVKINGLIDNLFDQRGANALAGYTAFAGTPLFWNIVPRNYELKLSISY